MSQFWSRKGTGSDKTSARHREMMTSEDRHRDCSNAAINPGVPGAARRGRDKKDLATEASQGLLSHSHFVIRLLASRTEQLDARSPDATVFQYLRRDAVEINMD